MSTGIKVLIILTIGFIAVAIYGGVSGNEAMLGTGAGGALLCLALMPALALRASRRRKIRERQDAYVCFEYSTAEAKKIAAAAKRSVRKTSIRVSVLLSICLAVIFVPFVVFSLEPGSALPSIWPIAVVCAALPWLSVPIAPAVVAHTVRSALCVSIVGRNCVLIANRYTGINDRYALEAEAVSFEPGANGGMATLHVRYRFRAGRTPRILRYTVAVPVPTGREAEAAAVRLEL